MKKYRLFFYFLFLSFLSYSQTNLVTNSGFENIDPPWPGDPDGCAHLDEDPGVDGDGYAFQIAYWNHVKPWTVPNFMSWPKCWLGRVVGSPDLKCEGGGHNSEHYCYCFYQEYILQQINTMHNGGRYYIEFYVKSGDITALHDGGLKFFVNRPQQCGSEGGSITEDGPADLAIPYGLNISNWTKVSGYYNAVSAFNWVGLGNFNTAGSKTGRSYSFDDITIIEVGSSACPDVNYIQNTTFQNIGKITFPSQNLTIAGNNVASTIAQGNVVIGSTAIVEFKSATKIVLDPGFSVEQGAYFEAHIAPCDGDCFPPTANAGADAISCSLETAQTIQLGFPSSEFEVTYSWSANPSSALAYLSNTTISNPVFTPPTSGNGRIVYTLKATNACGQSVTDNVTITYEANPNNSPTVSVSNINYSDLIEFDANFSSHTEQLIIEVWTAGGSLINTYNYYAGTDFNSNTYHWKIPAGLDPCQDYKIKVYTKNLCSSVLSAPYIITWARNRNLSFIYPIANVITPTQPSWCFNFTGGTHYDLIIYNRYGTPIYIGSGIITPPSACVWSGQCNQPACSQSTVTTDAVYFPDLTVTGCNGNTIHYTGFINNYREMNTLTDTTQSATAANNVSSNQIGNNQIKAEIYPNPNTGSFTIKLTGEQDQKTINKITIYDAMGNIIQKTELLNEAITIDISSQAKGMYFIKIENEQGIKVEKIIYQ